MEIEQEMLAKCEKANQWIDEAVKSFASVHDDYLK
jgi:hypothetical protein